METSPNDIDKIYNKEKLLNLNNTDLTNVCRTNKQAEKICDDDQFWNLRIQRMYGSDLSKYMNDKTYKEIYKDLTYFGDDINKVLIEASKLGYLPVVQHLVEQGTDANGRNGHTLIWASCNGHLSVVKYLIEHSADIHSLDDKSLRLAATFGHLRLFTYLLEHGANIHANNDEALETVQRGDIGMIKYLLNYMKTHSI